MRKAIDILIDTSASMGQPITGGPEASTKYQAVFSYVRDIFPKIYEPDLHYGLCTFGARLQGTERDGTTIERLLEINQYPQTDLTDKLSRIPEKLSYPAGTPLADAILNSIEELKKCDVEHRSIFVFSDGEDNGSNAAMEQVLTVAREVMVSLGWNYFEIYAIGIGLLDGDLRFLSEETGGIAIEVNGDKPSEIQEVFTNIALKHLSPSKREARFAEISGRDLIVPATTKQWDAEAHPIQESANLLDTAVAVSSQGALANKAAIDELKISIDALRQSIVENKDSARVEGMQILYKARNAWRAICIMGLCNFCILVGLVVLVAWTADGVFNMWNVITHLSIYLTQRNGG